jgi:hypothetical protein
MAIVMSGLFIAVERLEQRRGLAEQGFVTPPNAFPMPVNAATWLPRYSGQDTTQAWRIRRDGDEYDVAALVYVEQRLNKKLIYFSNRIADEYALRDSGQLTVAPGFAVNTAIVFEKGWRLIWWFWWVDGATSTNAFETKLLQLRAMLFGDPSAALITVSTACSDDGCQKTKARTQADIAALLMDIRQLQPRR